MKLILYPNENGAVAIVFPTGALTVEETARKDVPAGAPYLIVEQSDLPDDWSLSAAWVADFSAPHGYGVGHEAWFAERAVQEGVS